MYILLFHFSLGDEEKGLLGYNRTLYPPSPANANTTCDADTTYQCVLQAAVHGDRYDWQQYSMYTHLSMSTCLFKTGLTISGGPSCCWLVHTDWWCIYISVKTQWVEKHHTDLVYRNQHTSKYMHTLPHVSTLHIIIFVCIHTITIILKQWLHTHAYSIILDVITEDSKTSEYRTVCRSREALCVHCL